MGATRFVVKNTFLLTVGLLAGRFLAFIIIRKMAPILGPSGVGVWGLATDITTILLTVANFGLGILVTREVTRVRAMTLPILWAALRVRWAMGVVCYLFLLAYIQLAGLAPLAQAAVLITGIAVFVETTSLACDAVLQAHEKVEYQTVGQLISAVIYFALAYWLLEAGHGLMGVIWANLLSRIARLLVMVPLMLTKTGPWRWRGEIGDAAEAAGATGAADAALSPGGTFEGAPAVPPGGAFEGATAPGDAAATDLRCRYSVRWMLKLGLPLFLSTTFGIIYYKVDVVMLMSFMGEAATGIYVLGHRPLDLLLIGPNIFAMALFPAMARYGATAMPEAARMGERSLRYMMLAALPVTLLCMLLAGPVVRLLDRTGEFPDSILVLRVVIWGLPFQAANTIFNRVLITAGREKVFVTIALISMIANVTLNVFLIPRFSYHGAAVATIVGLATSCALHIFYVRRTELRTPLRRAVGGSAVALALAWLVAAGAVRLLAPEWGTGWWSLPLGAGFGPVLVMIGATTVLYMLAVFGLRVLRGDDVGLLKQLIGRQE